MYYVSTAAKYPLPPYGGRFCEKNFLRYLVLCYVSPSIIGCEPIRSLKKLFCKIFHLWGNGYFAGAGICALSTVISHSWLCILFIPFWDIQPKIGFYRLPIHRRSAHIGFFFLCSFLILRPVIRLNFLSKDAIHLRVKVTSSIAVARQNM